MISWYIWHVLTPLEVLFYLLLDSAAYLETNKDDKWIFSTSIYVQNTFLFAFELCFSIH